MRVQRAPPFFISRLHGCRPTAVSFPCVKNMGSLFYVVFLALLVSYCCAVLTKPASNKSSTNIGTWGSPIRQPTSSTSTSTSISLRSRRLWTNCNRPGCQRRLCLPLTRFSSGSTSTELGLHCPSSQAVQNFRHLAMGGDQCQNYTGVQSLN